MHPTLVLLATGGTIAGTAANALDNIGYQAATVGIAELLTHVPALQQLPANLESKQILQRDSKDMDSADWLLIAREVRQALERPEVCAVVITHGTDTLEETAWFLHRCLPPSGKPVVLASAMRPASSTQADGPQNLLDACYVTLSGQLQGVFAVAAGEVHHAQDVQKVQPYAIPAFSSGTAGPVALVQGAKVQRLRNVLPAHTFGDTTNWQAGHYRALLEVDLQQNPAPAVAWLTSHAGFDARILHGLSEAGFAGLLIATTGNGTLHHALEQALEHEASQGLIIRRCSRCAGGTIVLGSEPERWPSIALPAAKARLELQMELWAIQIAL